MHDDCVQKKMKMKQWEYIIKEEEDGKSLEKILRTAGFSKKEISRQKFLPDGITLDGEKCRVNQAAKKGQVLILKFKEVSIPEVCCEKLVISETPEILYEDDSLLIVDKPSGMPCHRGRGHYKDNLGSFVQNYCSLKGECFPVREIGRLDKDTSGLVVFAKSKTAAARLWKQRQDGRFQKKYKAWVHGKMKQPEGIIRFPVAHIPGEKNKMCVIHAEEKREAVNLMSAVTHYRVIEEKNGKGGVVSLVECTLETGRTHQIRVHMSSIGYPLLGDRIYGIADDAERLYLHAESLILFQPFTGAQIMVETKGF